MEYLAKVEISLKSGLTHPEGETTSESLRDLGYKVRDVYINKVYYIQLSANSKKEANKHAHEMCKKLLANPVKDDYKIEVVRVE